MKRILLLLAGLLPALAESGLPDLSPVTARYRVTVNGIPVSNAATVTLGVLDGERHEASFEVENRFFRHHEVSRFDWHACHVTPREYEFDFSGFGLERHSSVTFDRARGIATETIGGQSREITLDADVADAFNMALLARCRLRDGAKSFDLAVIYRGQRRDLHFDVTGEDRIETPYGIFDTVVVERRYSQFGRHTRIWVAPALDWFMVRLEHEENPVTRGSMVLTDFSRAAPQPTPEPPGSSRVPADPHGGGHPLESAPVHAGNSP